MQVYLGIQIISIPAIDLCYFTGNLQSEGFVALRYITNADTAHRIMNIEMKG